MSCDSETGLKGATSRGIMAFTRKRHAYPVTAERFKVPLTHGICLFCVPSSEVPYTLRLTMRIPPIGTYWYNLLTIDPAVVTSPSTNTRLMSLVIVWQLGRV